MIPIPDNMVAELARYLPMILAELPRKPTDSPRLINAIRITRINAIRLKRLDDENKQNINRKNQG